MLELSNNAFVNIQYGRNGFSLKEFNEKNFEGENILNAIENTWGEEESPVSFCHLGYANYEYEKLKKKLNEIKESEKKRFIETGKTTYNSCFRNCQHFACNLKKILI